MADGADEFDVDFDEQFNLPSKLRWRIKHWNKPHMRPMSQYSQYGPLDKYFNLRLPDAMVKPQGRLRKPTSEGPLYVGPDEVEEDQDESVLGSLDVLSDIDDQSVSEYTDDSEDRGSEEGVSDRLYTTRSHRPQLAATGEDGMGHNTGPANPQPNPPAQEADDWEGAGNFSFDSNGAHVYKKKKKYPDFILCSYDANQEGQSKDSILAIVEVLSLNGRMEPTEVQRWTAWQHLLEYCLRLGKEGERWSGHVLGICILGTEVRFLDVQSPEWGNTDLTWHSIYSDEWVRRMEQLSDKLAGS